MKPPIEYRAAQIPKEWFIEQLEKMKAERLKWLTDKRTKKAAQMRRYRAKKKANP